MCHNTTRLSNVVQMSIPATKKCMISAKVQETCYGGGQDPVLCRQLCLVAWPQFSKCYDITYCGQDHSVWYNWWLVVHDTLLGHLMYIVQMLWNQKVANIRSSFMISWHWQIVVRHLDLTLALCYYLEHFVFVAYIIPGSCSATFCTQPKGYEIERWPRLHVFILM